jgi:LacI family repressor for deo operon, udp, cdd, tsx, nupC, and nupG
VPGFDLAAGAEGARRLLALPEPPSALFAIADTLALGALQFIKASGRKVPEDFALVGFNDIPLAALVEPALTSVAAPAEELGRQAMGMLRELIAGRPPAQREIVLPVSLAVRESCGSHS